MDITQSIITLHGILQTKYQDKFFEHMDYTKNFISSFHCFSVLNNADVCIMNTFSNMFKAMGVFEEYYESTQ